MKLPRPADAVRQGQNLLAAHGARFTFRRLLRRRLSRRQLSPPSDLPPGCAFAPRCDKAMKICMEAQPEEIRINSEHSAACWMNVKKAYEEAGKENA